MDARAPRGGREQTLPGRLRRPAVARAAAIPRAPSAGVRGAAGAAGAPARGVLPSLGAERLERLVLVAHTFGRARAPALLEGLRARECLEALAQLGRLQ